MEDLLQWLTSLGGLLGERSSISIAVLGLLVVGVPKVFEAYRALSEFRTERVELARYKERLEVLKAQLEVRAIAKEHGLALPDWAEEPPRAGPPHTSRPDPVVAPQPVAPGPAPAASPPAAPEPEPPRPPPPPRRAAPWTFVGTGAAPVAERPPPSWMIAHPVQARLLLWPGRIVAWVVAALCGFIGLVGPFGALLESGDVETAKEHIAFVLLGAVFYLLIAAGLVVMARRIGARLRGLAALPATGA